MLLATMKAVSEVASSAPSPMADSAMTHSTALTEPATDVIARRGPWFSAWVMHMSMVGPGVTISTATAATYNR
jgi:hypothetical protein